MNKDQVVCGYVALTDAAPLIREDRQAALLRAFPEAQAWPEDSMFFGGVHAVARDARGGVEAGADHRRDGAVIIG